MPQENFDDLSGVEIMHTGVIRGREYKETDLLEIAENTNRLIQEGLHNPPNKLGHDDDQAFALASGLPAIGWFENFRVKGGSLLADLKNAPAIIMEAMKKKLYRKLSPEIYFDLPHPQTGNIIGKAIRAVALLGADIPEIKGLKDLLSETKPLTISFSEAKHERATEINIVINEGGTPKGPEGPNLAFTPEEDAELAVLATAVADNLVVKGLIPKTSMSEPNLDALVNWVGLSGFDACVSTAGVREKADDPEKLCGWLKAQARKKGVLGKAHMEEEIMPGELEKLQEELKTKDSALAAALKDKEAAEARYSETAKALVEREKQDGQREIAQFIEANKSVLTPAVEPAFKALCEALDAGSKTVKLGEKAEEKPSRALALAFAEQLINAKVAQFGETAKNEGNEKPEAGVKGADLNNELHAKAVAYAEANKVSYWDAVKTVSKEDPTLINKEN